MSIILLIIVVACIFALIASIQSALWSLFTLSFLPNGLYFLNNTEPNTVAIPLLGGIFNYISILICNITDFFLWFISWIPGLSNLIKMVYRSPDLDLAFNLGHRNFITHSVINPVFIGFVVISAIIVLITKHFKVLNSFLRILVFLTGMTFVCHLLADTMPKGWTGTAYIYFKLWSMNFPLRPAFLSLLWLYINSLFALCVSTFLLTVGADD